MAVKQTSRSRILAALAAGMATLCIPAVASAQDSDHHGGWRGGGEGRGNAGGGNGGGGGGWQGRAAAQAANPAPAPAPAPQVQAQPQRTWTAPAQRVERQVPAPQVQAQPPQGQVRSADQGGWRGSRWQGNRDGVPANPAAGVNTGQWRGNDARGNMARGNGWQGDRNDQANRGQWNRGGDANRGDWNRGQQERRGDWNRGQQAYRGDWNRGNSGNRWNNGWRNDSRYNWQGWRNQHRDAFHAGRYRAPFSDYRYNRLGIGFYLEPMFFGYDYLINDPWEYRLPPAYGPYRWVRYYNDVMLVDTETGEVADVIYDFFW